jgi:hypothetical protein
MSGPTVNKLIATIPKLEIQMNIKRAFLAAIAVLMMPAVAMAQNTFLTGVEFTNDGDGTALATITCNSGVPLVQSFTISEGNPVGFVVAGIIEGSTCEITLTDIPGYLIGAESNQVETGSSCVFLEFDFEDGEDVCEFLAVPLPFTYRVNKVWPVGDLNEVSQLATYLWACSNVALDATTDVFINISGSQPLEGDGSFTRTFFADPANGSTCTTTEVAFDSAVESDQGCQPPIHFVIGDTLKSCTITNSVFFEGIPTLSQYGLAIMALLMLGVGFVGFRRFV